VELELAEPLSPLIMIQRPETRIAFADDSHHNVGRYKAIGLITVVHNNLSGIRTDIGNLLRESGVTEFKWSKLRTARDRFAALKIIDYVLQGVSDRGVHVDVLSWDIEDTRHRIHGRDDQANLQRMYYHLIKNTLLRRWPRCSWHIYLDENPLRGWNEVKTFINRAILRDVRNKTVLIRLEGDSVPAVNWPIEIIQPCDSKNEPLVQVADLFAGLSVYSRGDFEYYQRWLNKHSNQEHLFASDEKDNVVLKPSDTERCRVLSDFDRRCKWAKLGVSLKSFRGLRTKNPRYPINFWWYEPQTDLDKAPLKKKDD